MRTAGGPNLDGLGENVKQLRRDSTMRDKMVLSWRCAWRVAVMWSGYSSVLWCRGLLSISGVSSPLMPGVWWQPMKASFLTSFLTSIVIFTRDNKALHIER